MSANFSSPPPKYTALLNTFAREFSFPRIPIQNTHFRHISISNISFPDISLLDISVSQLSDSQHFYWQQMPFISSVLVRWEKIQTDQAIAFKCTSQILKSLILIFSQLLNQQDFYHHHRYISSSSRRINWCGRRHCVSGIMSQTLGGSKWWLVRHCETLSQENRKFSLQRPLFAGALLPITRRFCTHLSSSFDWEILALHLWKRTFPKFRQISRFSSNLNRVKMTLSAILSHHFLNKSYWLLEKYANSSTT